jgi:hypothetical protein
MLALRVVFGPCGLQDSVVSWCACIAIGACRGIWEAAWARALQATDWAQLSAEKPALTDEDFGARLQATLAARAAQRCYSPARQDGPPLLSRYCAA